MKKTVKALRLTGGIILAVFSFLCLLAILIENPAAEEKNLVGATIAIVLLMIVAPAIGSFFLIRPIFKRKKTVASEVIPGKNNPEGGEDVESKKDVESKIVSKPIEKKPTKIRIVISSILLIFIVFCVIEMLSGNDDTLKNSSTDEVAPKIEKPSENSNDDYIELKAIPRIEPVDVYGNFVKKGFTLKKDFGKYKFWYCKLEQDDREYMVTVSGADLSTVTGITATAIVYDGNWSREDREYIQHAASIPYGGSNPQQAMEWTKSNFDKGGKTKIGDVTFELAVNKTLRMLRMYVK